MAQLHDPRKRGIPTMYRGRRYRSRLEARWAAFFDLAGWPYEYEPFDLDGWIPDFVLQGPSHETQRLHRTKDQPLEGLSTPLPVLVEVKPTIAYTDFPWGKITQACEKQYGPTPELAENVTYNVLGLGHSIFMATAKDSEWWPEAVQLGWLGQSAAILNNVLGRLDFFPSFDNYTDLIHGTYEGGHKHYLATWAHAQFLWNEAGNRVQWKAPR